MALIHAIRAQLMIWHMEYNRILIEKASTRFLNSVKGRQKNKFYFKTQKEWQNLAKREDRLKMRFKRLKKTTTQKLAMLERIK